MSPLSGGNGGTALAALHAHIEQHAITQLREVRKLSECPEIDPNRPSTRDCSCGSNAVKNSFRLKSATLR